MPPPIRVLHAIHDYLPRHLAGSELYVAHLSDEQRRQGDQPAVLAAEFDAADSHGRLRWRRHGTVPVAELVNAWHFDTFEDTYLDEAITNAVDDVLAVLRPHVVHIHNLLNLTFALPSLARARGIPVVATLHDHTLVCPSGGQRLHRREQHVCRTIDPARCARCFRESPFHAQWRVGRLTSRAGSWAGRAAHVARRLAPAAAEWLGAASRRLPGPPLDAAAIERRLAAARDAFDQCDIVVAPSPAIGREFEALGFSADRLLVSDYGFPDLHSPPRTAAHDGRLRVGFVGTLVWHKGVDLLIDAAAMLPAERVTVQIHGDPSVFPQYSADLAARAKGRPVIFGGAVSRARIGEVLAGLDVLAVPSRWLENSPLVIHEAFQAGVPVIAAAIGGSVDLLAHGGGILVPPDDPRALADAIIALLDERSRVEALRAAIPRVKSIRDDAAEWRVRYARLLERRAAAAS